MLAWPNMVDISTYWYLMSMAVIMVVWSYHNQKGGKYSFNQFDIDWYMSISSWLIHVSVWYTMHIHSSWSTAFHNGFLQELTWHKCGCSDCPMRGWWESQALFVGPGKTHMYQSSIWCILYINILIVKANISSQDSHSWRHEWSCPKSKIHKTVTTSCPPLVCPASDTTNILESTYINKLILLWTVCGNICL